MAHDTRLPQAFNVLEKIQPLLPEIAKRADEIEQFGAVPGDLNERLGEAGAFTMLIPASHGGAEVRPIEAVQVLEALARVDASVAWTSMVSTGMNSVLGRFSRSMIDKVFTTTARGLVRGATAPKGLAEPVEGGYRVKGRWSLGSGSYDYQWVVANCVIMEDGKPRMGSQGPALCTVIVPKGKANFLDTWHAVGLKGSASHDFVIDEEFVPMAQTTDAFSAASSFDAPVHRLPLFMLISTPHAGVAVGIAQGAIDDVVAIAKSKRPAFDPRMLKENPVFNFRFGEIVSRLEGARALLHREANALWEIANSGVAATPLQAAHTMAMASFIQRQCVDIVQIAFELAGANACYESSVLQRRWRDIRCLGQHVAAGSGHLETYGQQLVAQVS